MKEILAHVTIWEEEALKHLPVLQRATRPWGGRILNARTTSLRSLTRRTIPPCSAPWPARLSGSEKASKPSRPAPRLLG